MRIAATALLSVVILGSAVTPGWSPGPADLKTPLSSYKNQNAVVIGPPDGRKTYGHGKGFGPSTGLQFQQYKGSGALSTGRTPGSTTRLSNRMNLKLLPQARPAKPAPR